METHSVQQLHLQKAPERKLSAPGSHDGSTNSSPSSTHSSTSLKVAAQFFKSVVIHSAAAFNNFDFMPLDSLDEASTPPRTEADRTEPLARTKETPTKIADEWKPPASTDIQSLYKANIWDSDRFRTLVARKPVPKSVTESAAYNLR
jgi:hypothetical protein